MQTFVSKYCENSNFEKELFINMVKENEKIMVCIAEMNSNCRIC